MRTLLCNELSQIARNVNTPLFYAWRRVRKKHIEEKGWKIDSRAMESLLQEKVFTIPSPARKSNPEFRWALETVPLVEPVKQSLIAVSDTNDKQA